MRLLDKPCTPKILKLHQPPFAKQGYVLAAWSDGCEVDEDVVKDTARPTRKSECGSIMQSRYGQW